MSIVFSYISVARERAGNFVEIVVGQINRTWTQHVRVVLLNIKRLLALTLIVTRSVSVQSIGNQSRFLTRTAYSRSPIRQPQMPMMPGCPNHQPRGRLGAVNIGTSIDRQKDLRHFQRSTTHDPCSPWLLGSVEIIKTTLRFSTVGAAKT